MSATGAIALTLGVCLLAAALVVMLAVRARQPVEAAGRHGERRSADAVTGTTAARPGSDGQWAGYVGGQVHIRRVAEEEAAADRRAAGGWSA